VKKNDEGKEGEGEEEATRRFGQTIEIQFRFRSFAGSRPRSFLLLLHHFLAFSFAQYLYLSVSLNMINTT